MPHRNNPEDFPVPTEPVYGEYQFRLDETVARTVYGKLKYRVIPKIPPMKSIDDLSSGEILELAEQEAANNYFNVDENEPRSKRVRHDEGTPEDIRSLAQEALIKKHNELISEVTYSLGHLNNTIRVNSHGEIQPAYNEISDLVDNGTVVIQVAREGSNRWGDIEGYDIDGAVDENSGESGRIADPHYSQQSSYVTKNPYWKPTPVITPEITPEIKRPRRRKVSP